MCEYPARAGCLALSLGASGDDGVCELDLDVRDVLDVREVLDVLEVLGPSIRQGRRTRRSLILNLNLTPIFFKEWAP